MPELDNRNNESELIFNKNKFNSYTGGINDNNYLKKFELGKELHNKNKVLNSLIYLPFSILHSK